jgi:hypothetical protein
MGLMRLLALMLPGLRMLRWRWQALIERLIEP